jgi:hypothetical protein
MFIAPVAPRFAHGSSFPDPDQGAAFDLRGQGFRSGQPAHGASSESSKQFVAWLKANPDQATFGVPSNGTIPRLACTHKLIMSAWLNGNTCRKNCRNVCRVPVTPVHASCLNYCMICPFARSMNREYHRGRALT